MSRELDTAIDRATEMRRRLSDAWYDAREAWDDQVAVAFEADCWSDIEDHLRRLLKAADELRRATTSS